MNLISNTNNDITTNTDELNELNNNFDISSVSSDLNIQINDTVYKHLDNNNNNAEEYAKNGEYLLNDIDAIAMWLREYIINKNTFDSYRLCVERFYLWLLYKNLTLAAVSRLNIQEYYDFLINPTPQDLWCGKKCPRNNLMWRPFESGLSNSSIRLQLQILTGLYNYLIDAGYLSRNPIRLMRIKPKVITADNKSLTITEKNHILNFIYNLPGESYKQKFYKEQMLWIISLLYLSACRRDEVTSAKMSDFFHKRNQWWFKVVGKGTKYGEIPVTESLMSALIRYRRFLGLPNFPSANEQTPVIVGLRGDFNKGITNTRLYQLIKELCRNVAIAVADTDSSAAFNLNNVSPHWFRHTSATHQVDAGIDIRIVKENLRHSKIETTMRYQHTEDDSRHRETTEKFNIT